MLSATRLAAQDPSSIIGGTTPMPMPVAQAVAVEVVPRLDGRLDEAVWNSAPLVTDFIQHEPRDGEPASERTEVRILFDRSALYVGVWLFDRDPSAIVIGESRRDIDLSNVDSFTMVLDTYLDRQNAFVFGTSPQGVEYDGQITREGEGGGGQATNRRSQAGTGAGLNLNWDGDWTVATTRDERGWYAEFRIPFSTLRYAEGGEQIWGLNFARNIRRKNEQDFWSPIPRQYTFYRVSLAGTLEGVQAPTQRIMTVSPYALSSVRRDYGVSDTDAKFEVGGEAKIGVTQGVTLDLTLNTDFAQVEVDDQQVNLTRFSLFFPEKRPFFLENAGTFAVGTSQTTELFFSRRIGIGPDNREVPLAGGARLTGKVAGLNVGLLDIQAKARDAIAPNNFGVVRLFKELPNRTRIGAIVVNRLNTDSTGDYNLTYGVDGQLGIGRTFLVDAYAAKTKTPGLSGRDHAFNIAANYTGREWVAGLAYRESAENFNPEVGFVLRENTRFVQATILRHVRTPNLSWFREYRPHITFRQWDDFDGFTESRLLHIDSHFQFANGAFFQLPAVNFEREGLKEPFEVSPGIVIPSGTYDGFLWALAYNSNLGAPVSVSGRVEIGDFYTGHRVSTIETVTARKGPTVVTLRLSYDNVHLPEGDFTNTLVGVKFGYSFSPRMYLQSLIQYNDQSGNIEGNFRFGWLSAAGTGLFIVYNDIERTSRFGRMSGSEERAFIVKFTRLLDLN